MPPEPVTVQSPITVTCPSCRKSVSVDLTQKQPKPRREVTPSAPRRAKAGQTTRGKTTRTR